MDEFMDDTLSANTHIEEMIHLFHQHEASELFTAVCLAIRAQMNQDGHFLFPADIAEDESGNPILNFKTLDFGCGPVLVAFTGMAEKEKAPPSDGVSQFIQPMLEALLQMSDIEGLLINPFSEPLFLGKEDIAMILTPGSERFIGDSPICL
mgnify:CR=1 FL=1